MITVIGLQLGAIIAFAIITETVFQWPGMGLMFIQAVQNADIPVMAAYLMLVAFMFVFINFVVDLIYVRVDPRIRIFGRSALRADAGRTREHRSVPVSLRAVRAPATTAARGGAGWRPSSTAICCTASCAPSSSSWPPC